MATVFETRLIGNIGKDAVVKEMDKDVIAVNFSVAHNKSWKDKKSNESKTKTTWINCTIWKRDGANLRVVDFLKKGALVEVIGTPFAKGFLQDNGTVRTEIRLNVTQVNILKAAKMDDFSSEIAENESLNNAELGLDQFTMQDSDF
jgi:single-strand DNA-binding protein